MVPAVKLSLQAARGFPAAVNFPRAHYPFPERGRCAFGVGVPLHPSVSRAAHCSGGGGGAWALEDCWSLGGEVPPRARPASMLRPEEAAGVLRAAFADADIFLNVSVPPRLPHSAQHPRFAAARCGVIWHRDQVERAEHAAPDGPQEDLSRRGATDRDLWGRSLPSQTLAAPSQGALAAGAFVSQDQTSAVAQRARGGGPGAEARPAAAPAAEAVSFTVGRGRTLSDPVVAGDVDALFGGRVAVAAAQAWPAGHPCSLTDAALAAAIAEDEETGLPLWLLP